MCVVSMVTDHYMQRWSVPQYIPPTILRDIEELIRKAREYDKLTGQPDCPEGAKRDWLTELEKLKVTMQPVNLTNMPPLTKYEQWPYPPDNKEFLNI